jgi:hypothetical protein
MASILTTLGKATQQKGVFGSTNNSPIYLQFVPGVCIEPITSTNSLQSYNNSDNVNSILAIPHIRNGVKKKKTMLNDNDRYFPLMRGFVDVPAKGDPVLLCEIGGKRYYLGPLNTDNQPNFNEDNLYEPELPLNSNSVEPNARLHKGESRNFKRLEHNRMRKVWNPRLDSTDVFNETHGDMMLEGRHGNSIRIGSRDENPYMYISNGRLETFTTEGYADGTLIAITNKGSLNQHFGGYAIQPSADDEDEARELEVVPGFILASDYHFSTEEPPKRLMANLVSSVNNDLDATDLIYRYGSEEGADENGATVYNGIVANQILFNSDRITINSKNEDMYLSSGNDIHIGTKRHLTISTSENLIIESEKTYLGDPNKKEMDNMVMGAKLQQVLKDILQIFSVAQYVNSGGPAALNPTSIEASVQKITGDIDTILSTKHFIEK